MLCNDRSVGANSYFELEVGEMIAVGLVNYVGECHHTPITVPLRQHRHDSSDCIHGGKGFWFGVWVGFAR